MNELPCVVTGGCGFLGSHLVEKLLLKSHASVRIIDNLSTGSLGNIQHLRGNRLSFYKYDLKDLRPVREVLSDVETIFHLAAYPDVQTGYDYPKRAYDQNIHNTFLLLENARKSNIKTIVFASSSTVYGQATIIPTPESYGPLQPVSHYGASKLACEAIISSYCHTYGFKSVLFRYANIVGSRSAHGVIRDFISKLLRNGRQLKILGDGLQTKSYIHMDDCLDAMFLVTRKASSTVEVSNVGNLDSISVIDIANAVCHSLGLRNVEYILESKIETGVGWIGDVKRMQLDITKLLRLGWRPKYDSFNAICRACKELTVQSGSN